MEQLISRWDGLRRQTPLHGHVRRRTCTSLAAIAHAKCDKHNSYGKARGEDDENQPYPHEKAIVMGNGFGRVWLPWLPDANGRAAQYGTDRRGRAHIEAADGLWPCRGVGLVYTHRHGHGLL